MLPILTFTRLANHHTRFLRDMSKKGNSKPIPKGRPTPNRIKGHFFGAGGSANSPYKKIDEATPRYQPREERHPA